MGYLKALLPAAALALLAGCGGVSKRGAACAVLPYAWSRPDAGIGEWGGSPYKIYVQRREIYWNATRVTPAQFRDYLERVGELEIPDRVVLIVAPTAECGLTRAVVADMKSARVCREHRLCGTLKRWPDPPPPPGHQDWRN